MRFLVTRPAGSWPALVRRLAEAGIQTEVAPTTVQVEPVDPAPGDAALARLGAYSWIVVTSGQGVKALALRLSTRGASAPPGASWAAVGPATARALEGIGVRVELVADDPRGEGLALRLAPRLTGRDRVLVVRPEGAPHALLAAALRARGAHVDEAPLYRTIPSGEGPRLARAAIEGRFDGIVWTAPSTLALWLASAPDPAGLRAALARALRIAIGPTTAAALAAEGLPAHEVAAGPEEGEIGDAILRAAGNMPPPRGGPLTETIRTTSLHRAHREAGARMVPFAGWDMPVQYTGVLDEHMAVRTKAGVFDVSHMGEVEVKGRGALDYLQHVTSNDVSRLTPGRIQYSALTTPQGTFVDDLLVYKLAEEDYLLVINAGNTPKDVAWLLDHARGRDVEVRDVSRLWCQIALQGPMAERILAPLTRTPLPAIKYYGFERGEVDGVGCLISRTGYTGEDGFELYGAWDDAERLWQAVLAAGAPHGLIPAGLAARDTLRLEAKMALYGNDIDDTTTVLEADLGWIVKLEKGDFLGREALLRQKAEGLARRLVGFETEGRAVARQGYEARHAGRAVGAVTSGSFAPFLRKNIGLAYLPVELGVPGTRFDIGIRGRPEPAVVVPTPFYKRPR